MALNEIAPGGVGAPAEGVNLTTAQGRKFVSTVTPPAGAPVPVVSTALVLDQAVNMIDLVRNDLNKVFPAVAESAPLFAVVDVLAALGHLRHAVLAIDKATDAIEADHKAVAR